MQQVFWKELTSFSYPSINKLCATSSSIECKNLPALHSGTEKLKFLQVSVLAWSHRRQAFARRTFEVFHRSLQYVAIPLVFAYWFMTFWVLFQYRNKSFSQFILCMRKNIVMWCLNFVYQYNSKIKWFSYLNMYFELSCCY